MTTPGLIPLLAFCCLSASGAQYYVDSRAGDDDIRDNWLGDIGGGGITPWATDRCLVEHNILQGANERAGTYNAGI